MIHINRQTGFATFPTILALAVLVLAAVVAISMFSLTESLATQSQAYSQTALFYAQTGARDALIRLSRNPNYSCAAPDPCYTIDFVTNGCVTNDGCAKVLMTGSGTSRTITSTGQVKNNTRKIQVTVTLSTEGEITTTVWAELTS